MESNSPSSSVVLRLAKLNPQQSKTLIVHLVPERVGRAGQVGRVGPVGLVDA